MAGTPHYTIPASAKGRLHQQDNSADEFMKIVVDSYTSKKSLPSVGAAASVRCHSLLEGVKTPLISREFYRIRDS